MSKVKSIVDWYFRQAYDDPWLDFEDYLVNAIEQSLDFSAFDAQQFAHDNGERIWNALRRRVGEDKRRGYYPTFSEVAEGVKMLVWNPRYFPAGLSRRERHTRLRIRSRSNILRAIQRMDEFQFEALSVLICKLSGAQKFCLTPSSGGDEGIDFFAIIPSIGKSRLFNGGAGPIRIVGQSKRHNNSVSPGDLREFLFTIGSVHQRSPEILKIIPPWFLGQKGPIVGWFVAHRGLQSGAREFADNFGIIHSDSRDLAEIITMSRSWTPSDGLHAPENMMWEQIEVLLRAKKCRET